MTYRVNLGVSRRGYEDVFGPAPRAAAGMEVLDTGFDRLTAWPGASTTTDDARSIHHDHHRLDK